MYVAGKRVREHILSMEGARCPAKRLEIVARTRATGRAGQRVRGWLFGYAKFIKEWSVMGVQ